MRVSDLSREQMIRLKQNMLDARNASGVSYSELADADSLVSDDEVLREFGSTEFVPEDFE